MYKTFADLHINIKFPEWNSSDFSVIRASVDKLESLQKKAGTGSDAFQKICEQIRFWAIYQPHNLLNGIQRPIEARAFAYLLLNDDVFRKKVTFSEQLSSGLVRANGKASRLTMELLLAAYFKHFDWLGGREFLEAFIIKQTRLLTMTGDNFTHRAVQLVDSNGPKWLASNAQSSGTDLVETFAHFGLNRFSSGRYFDTATAIYYVERLRTIPANNSTDPLFAEIQRQDVYEMPYGDQEFLGHEILRILIDRVQQGDVPRHWQEVVLTIAGDPRVVTSSKRYQRWWLVLGTERIRKVKAWLSKLDLKLFLEALKESAERSRNTTMMRMFASRKTVMEGLLEMGLVKDSRLFLSLTAERYLRQNYKPSELPDFAKMNSQDTSVIYLDLGKLHMIEGSHTFKVKLLDELPSQLEVLNYGKRKYDDTHFREHVKRCYFSDTGMDDGFLDAAHDVHLNWVNKMISFMKNHGIKVNPQKLLDSSNYKAYKEKFGVS